MTKLSVSNGKFGPEKKSKFLIHYGLGALLLCPLDLLKTHIPEADRQLPGCLMIFHGLLIVKDFSRGIFSLRLPRWSSP